jgi:hypothetical protein
MRKILLIVVIIVPLLTVTLSANGRNTTIYSADGTNYVHRGEPVAEREKQFIPIPIVFYTPETSIAFGGSLVYIRSPLDVADAKTDVWNAVAFYTFKKQILTAISGEQYFGTGGLKLDIGATVAKFPDKFWGIGPDTPSENEEDYTQIEFNLNAGLLWEVHHDLYIGPYYIFSYFGMKETQDGGLLDQGIITGSDGTIVSGIGLKTTLDRRDDVMYPKTGYRFDLEFLWHPLFIGSNEKFSQAMFDYRQFFPLFRKHVFAIQYILELSTGTVPFQAMPGLGGRNIMRGFYEGRYRDLNYTAFQAEYRFPLFWNFGGVVFGSVGKVAPNVNKLPSTENIRVSGGSGIRYTIDRDQGVNLRFDFAISSEGFSVYFNILEAF